MDNHKNNDKRAKQKNGVATVPGVVAVDDADGTFVPRGKILAQTEREALAGETSSLRHTSKRLEHAQDIADAARLRNKYSLENEEKTAEDDCSFAAPGAVEFVRNGSEVSHGCITLSKYDQKGSLLI